MNAIEKINSFLWGYPVLIILIGGGIFLSIRLKFPQIRILKIFKTLFASLFDKQYRQGSLTRFQSFSTALAATVGTGSIVGVGAAIAVGGEGAVFWMWISAFIGMGISYSENFLAAKYSKNSHLCGAICYLKKLNSFMPLCYALFSVLAAFGMGCMVQANCACDSASYTFNISPKICCAAIILFVISICAGKNFAAKICEKLVPFMALFFILGSLWVILSHPRLAAASLKNIFTHAFTPNAAIGGSIGTVCIEGIKRGAFSNEAGLGSSCAVNSGCETKSNQIQGIMGMAEVFADTIIICTLSALVILISKTPLSDNCAITGYSSALGYYGKYFISICLILFSLAAMAGWFFIGEKSWQYLFGFKKTFSVIYRMLFILCAFFGSVYTPGIIWGISDIFNALTAIPNMTAVLILSKEIQPPFSSNTD